MKVASAAPLETQRATGGVPDVTAHATQAQPGTLKALANAVLARNRVRNDSATEGENARNPGSPEAGGKLRRLGSDCAAPAPLPDPGAETRHQRVLAMLAANPMLRYAVVCDGEGDPVPVAVAIRDKGSCEVHIPAARFEPFALIELVKRHGAMVH